MAHSVIEQIETHFFYLFDEYGFRVFSSTIWHESFGNWVVVLLSDGFRITLFHDRGDVTLLVGPLWSPPGWQAGPWYDLPLVVEFLTLGSSRV